LKCSESETLGELGVVRWALYLSIKEESYDFIDTKMDVYLLND